MSKSGADPHSLHPLSHLHDPGTIRARCAAIVRSVDNGVSASFALDRNRLPAVAERVAVLTRQRYPDLQVPGPSHWRHLQAGAADRRGELDALLAGRSASEQARARWDLTVVSVLLGAGAGSRWRYTEAPAGGVFTRSEGLAVACFRAFVAGSFSAHAADPLRVDAAALLRVDASWLRGLFQSGNDNPMPGLDGRAALMSRLGQALQAEAARSGLEPRPALMLDRLGAGGTRRSVAAPDLLAELLRTLSPAWPGGSRVQGLAAGDVWPHRWAGSATGGGGADRITDGWVPLHLLGQWLAYSLQEPLLSAGVALTDLDALTGLADYRNGGLLLDAGVIVPRNPRLLARTWKAQDEFIVEWRALTVALLDELAPLVRQRLGLTAQELPLAGILEGGTWAAGREIALELRSDGAPPLRFESDGTVF